ncbi:MAG: protein kinase, partial [Candidatus Berkiella sp.]
LPTVRESKISREDEFKNAKAILDRALAENPNLTSFKINRKSHTNELEHSFICLRNKEGQFEIYRMAADVLGKGTEGKFKVIDREDGTELGVKISEAKTSKNSKQRLDEELQMMDDVGLLIGQFMVEREEKHDKTLNKKIGNKLYVVQPYIKGQELAKLLANNKLNSEQKLVILREVLACLKHTHELGIIHRDIKPENIIVTFDSKGNVRDCTIIDYGVSFRASPGETVVKSYAGTPAYLPPEIGRKEFKKEYSEFLKLSNQMQKLQERKALLTKGKNAPILGLDRLEHQITNLQAKIDEQKGKYLAVLTKDYSFSSSVDTYAVGVIATRLGINLAANGLDGLLAESPNERMAAAQALTIVQNQLSVSHASKLVKGKKPASYDSEVSSTPSTPQRLPSMVNAAHLNDINGKQLLITKEQLTKLKSFQARKQNGLFQIDDRLFLIDANFRLYAVYQHLAKGGQGTVSLGQDLETGNWVAIKHSGDKVTRESTPYVVSVLERESQILKELGQLVGVVSAVRGQFNNHEEVHGLSIQPFAFGKEYHDIAKAKEKVPADQAVLMSLRLFDELDKLHQNGILHLDIKPANLKWDSETNTCRILDMGTAITKEQQQEPLLYETRELIGTLEYRPPELNQRMKPYSNKVDVYAAAKSLKKLLDNTKDLSESERQQIDDFITKAMSDNPAERPTAAQAKVFFNQLAVKMQQEKRLVDVEISVQIAQSELSAFIEANEFDKDKLHQGVNLFLESTYPEIHLQDKIEIAKEVLQKLNSLRLNVEVNEGHFSEYHFLALAEILIEARAKNIDDIDIQLEHILKKPSDQLALQFKRTQKEQQTLALEDDNKENIQPAHSNAGNSRRAPIADAYRNLAKNQSSMQKTSTTHRDEQTVKADATVKPGKK